MRHPHEIRGFRLMARGLLPHGVGMNQRKLSPMLAASVMTLVLTIVGFWGYATQDARGARVAHIGRTLAPLNDGLCTFSATVTLKPEWQSAFERKQGEVRQALVAILRTKSRYMVSNPTAREALRRQMVREVNRVLDEPVADEIEFTEFVLS
jgi:hypothetical protein